jgi:hypothetical protein
MAVAEKKPAGAEKEEQSMQAQSRIIRSKVVDLQE